MSDWTFEQLLKNGCDLLAEKRLGEAEVTLKKALARHPESSLANHFTGLVLALRMQLEQAMPLLNKAVEIEPDNVQFRYNLATTSYQLKLYDQALFHFKRLLSIKPDHLGALINCGGVYNILGYPSEAEKILKSAIRKKPAQAMAHINLGNALEEQGRIDEAMGAYRQAIAIEPESAYAHSNLLLASCYSARLSQDKRYQMHLQWERYVRRGAGDFPNAHAENIYDRPLRIGYISPDFRLHSVAYFLEPLLQFHTKSLFEIYCYSDVAVPDDVTKRLQTHVHKWRIIAGATDTQVADQVYNDRIDILVDLAGHSGKNRLGVFMMKPAAIQVTYLGYPATTGLSTMDYRLTDEYADPAGQEIYHTEELYRLPASFLCYRPPEIYPKVAESPCRQNGYITFGSFNNLPKISEDVIRLWADILTRIPSSRMVIKTRQTRDPVVCKRIGDSFAAFGIEPARIQFLGHVSNVKDHLCCYNKIDIALDTFPYNGTTTTFEALWMGVPVVSLRGDHHASRVGYSIMSNLGLESLVAETPEKYSRIATFLSEDISRLGILKKSLRGVLSGSVLCDSRGFVQKVELAYREMIEKKYSRKTSS